MTKQRVWLSSHKILLKTQPHECGVVVRSQMKIHAWKYFLKLLLQKGEEKVSLWLVKLASGEALFLK